MAAAAAALLSPARTSPRLLPDKPTPELSLR
jgi:hypothetical protein